jgi:hypothetical protein
LFIVPALQRIAAESSVPVLTNHFFVGACTRFTVIMSTHGSSDAVLNEILDGMKALRRENEQLASTVDAINGRVNMLAGIKQLKDEAQKDSSSGVPEKAQKAESEQTVEAVSKQYEQPPSNVDDAPPRRTSVSKTSKIILTSYPGQAGVDPMPMDWGHKDPAVRGPVVVSRHPGTIRRRNGKFYGLFTIFPY